MFTDMLFASGGWLVFGLLIAPILLLFGAAEGAGVIIQAVLAVCASVVAWFSTALLGSVGRGLGRSLRPLGMIVADLAPLALKALAFVVLAWSFDPVALLGPPGSRLPPDTVFGTPWPPWARHAFAWLETAPWQGVVTGWWRLVGQAPTPIPPAHAAWTASMTFQLAHVTASAVGLALFNGAFALALSVLMGIEITVWTGLGWQDPARPAAPARPAPLPPELARIVSAPPDPRLTPPPDWAALIGEREARRYD
ncbi:MAG: hypothetical protein K6V97_11150 [Actinomycetia bacterium]|nr:hypothetical protein [Actinomycetes bacterium]